MKHILTQLFKALVLLPLLLPMSTEAYTNLSFSDPRSWDTWGTPSIETAEMNIRPSGLHFEVELTLEFSAAGYDLTADDTVEVTMDLDLPPNSAFTDSYLWVGDSLVQAGIYDVSVARQVYEDIVDRRLDPSILYKYSDGYFQLRIFPMEGDKSRTVVLKYLIPAQWEASTVSVPLLNDLMSKSENPVSDLLINYYPNSEFNSPELRGSNETFTQSGDKFTITLSGTEVNNASHLVFNSPMAHEDHYFKSYYDGDEGYFQLVLDTKSMFDIEISRKTVVLIDYDSTTTSRTKSEIESNLESLLQTNFTEADSFLVLYNNKNANTVTSSWMTLSSTVSYLDGKSVLIGDTSTLINSLETGLAITEGMENVNYLLMTSSGQYDDRTTAQEKINELFEEYGDLPAMMIAGFADKSNQYYYVDSVYYYWYNPWRHNQFLQLLASRTGGRYQYSYWYTNNLQDNLKSLVEYFQVFYTSLQIYPVMDNGYTYSVLPWENAQRDQYYYPIFFDNVAFKTAETNVALHSKNIILGKYQGELPLEVHISAEIDGTVHHKKLILNGVEGTDIVKKTWLTTYMNDLDNQYYSLLPSQKDDLIDLSVENRILSRATAFLALEPGMTVPGQDQGETGSAVTMSEFSSSSDGISYVISAISTEEEIEGDLNGFPVPATSEITFNYDGFDTLEIFNVAGQLVATIVLDEIGSTTWDLTSNGSKVEPGIYLVKASSENSSKTIRIVVQ